MHIPFQFEVKGKLILGMFHTANQQRQIPVVLIMCYGLNGNRVVQHRISVKLGEISENEGINLIRFDYRNVGVSEGRFEQSNIEDRVDDIIEVCKYAKSCFYDQAIKIVLIGFSDGARNALQVTKTFDIDGLILWNPIFNVPQKSDATIDSNKKKLILHPLYKTPIKKLLGVGLSLDMIKQIESEDALISLRKYENNILLLFGDNDALTKNVRFQLTTTGLINKSNVDYVIIKNADHLFNRSTYVNEVFDATTDWVICNFDGRSNKNHEKY
mgnify:CR=1 FL=1|jgi:hypothetical protein